MWEQHLLLEHPDRHGLSWWGRAAYCPECWAVAIEIKNSGSIWYTIHPASGHASAQAPRELANEHPDVARDYVEANALLSVSPRASAAMSRRCLQHTIRKKAAVTKKTLNAEIEALLATNILPSYIADDLHHLRELGNRGAHPLESEVTGDLIDVDSEEAEWSIAVLDRLIDFYYVQPAKSLALKAKLDAKRRGAKPAGGGAPA